MVVVSNNVELFLKKIGRSARVNKTDFGIFASEHSEIDGEDIVEIKTDPPNAWIRKGGKIKFIYPCRIYDVQMKEGMVVESAKVPEFLKEKMGEVIMNQEAFVNVPGGGTIIIDSTADLISSNLFKCTKGGGSVVMTAVGKFCIPASMLQPNTEYNLMLSTQSLNGNGRFGVQLVSNNGKCFFDIISNLAQLNTKFVTGARDPGETYSLNIYRPAKMSTGNVAIHKVKIWSDKSVSPYIEPNFVEPIKIEQIEAEDGYWKLKNIPKIVHFYWGGSKLTFLRYISMYSFRKYNPDWRIKLHIPEILNVSEPTWYSGEQSGALHVHGSSEDYFDKLEHWGIEIVKHNFEHYAFKNEVHEVHKSDFLRWILLYTEGGVWSDNDIIYTKPISDLVENNIDNKQVDTGVCTYFNGYHAIGFLLSSPNNVFWRSVSQSAKQLFCSSSYQGIGSYLLNSKYKVLKKCAPENNIIFMNPNGIYSIDCDHINLFLSDKPKIEDYPQAIGFHWYGGNNDITKFEGIINNKNYKEFNNFLSKLVIKTIGDEL